MRRAIFAGSFYPKSQSQLSKTLESCFIGKLGPGELPGKVVGKSALKAVLVPHAGYSYSGMAAAWAYKAIAETVLPDVFILIGPSHITGQSGICNLNFETPLGVVRIDQDLAKVISSKANLCINNDIHLEEHSLEVQLPFLQFSLGNLSEKIKILPILISDDVDFAVVSKDIKSSILELKKKVTFIISSDLTHFGPNYHYIPFKDDVKKNLSKLDNSFLNLIKSKDFEGILSYVSKTQITVCGLSAILLMLKCVDFDRAMLEQYYTSGDVVNEYMNSVSYASMVFK